MKHIKFRLWTLDSNSHGRPWPTTLKATWQIVRMGSYAKIWTLYIYGRMGKVYALTVTFPLWRGPWPEKCSEPEPRKDHP